MAAQLEAYGISLEGHDERDIGAAVRRFIRGEVDGHNQSFPPTASKLGGVVRKCLMDRLDSEERDRLSRPALPPPEIDKSDLSRERVRLKMDAAIKSLSRKMLTPQAAREHDRSGPA